MLLVLTRNTVSDVSKRLVEESIKKNIEIDVINYLDILHGVKNNESFIILPNGKKLEDYTKVILRSAIVKDHSLDDLKYNIILYLQKKKISALNLNSYSKYPFLGKLAQGSILANNKVPTIDYRSFGNKESLHKYIETIGKFPLIIKSKQGSHGRTVKKVNSISELNKYVNEFKLENVLIQPLINCKQWYRTVVIKNARGEFEYLGYREQLQREQYLYSDNSNNTITRLSDSEYTKLKELSIKCAQIFNLDYCGIDLLYNEDTKDFVVVEVNRTAVFTMFEKHTGINVGERLV